MGVMAERAAFDGRFGDAPLEITVLTGEYVGGAGKSGRAKLWTVSADILAYVDETGALVEAKGQLEWLGTEDDRDGWVHQIEPTTQYRMVVRRAVPADPARYAAYSMPTPDFSHTFALAEVVERGVHFPALDERLNRYLQPIVLNDQQGTFTLDRSFGQFAGQIAWPTGEVSVSLEIDETSQEGAETCEDAMATLARITADADIDARWRSYAASVLTELANEWRDDEDAPIAEADFASRISLSELNVSPDGSVTPYYRDGNLFFGHVIIIDVEPDGSLSDASIAG